MILAAVATFFYLAGLLSAASAAMTARLTNRSLAWEWANWTRDRATSASIC